MNALVLPIVVPLATAGVLLLSPKRAFVQCWVGFAGAVLLLGSGVSILYRVNTAGIQVLQISGWPAPFGITLVADLLAALLVTAAGIVAVAVTVAAVAGVDPKREAFGYHALVQLLFMGVAGAFLTGDLFNLYVWFELMLVASFVLMSMYRTRPQVEAAFKYVAMNLVASAIFLTGLGLLYGAAGTLNMADLARIWPTLRPAGIDTVLAVLFLVAFSIKAGLFPLFFWLPASYHTPPAVVGAAFAGLLTKVGVYALMRTFTLFHAGASPNLFTLLLVMSAATMVIGVVAALGERDFRRILSFNLVGHIGYTTASLAVLTPAALAGAIFYVLHHIVVITNLFLVSAVMLRLRRTTNIAGLGGLYRDRPVFSLLAMVPIFSLAGVPPLSGFLGKVAILRGTFGAGAYWVGALVLVSGLVTLVSMGRAWADAFWRPPDDTKDFSTPGTPLLAAIAILCLVTLAMTAGAESLYGVTVRGAQQLMQPDEYVRAVLAGGR